MKMRTAPWSAAAELPPYLAWDAQRARKAATPLPHSKVPSAQAFSWQRRISVAPFGPATYEELQRCFAALSMTQSNFFTASVAGAPRSCTRAGCPPHSGRDARATGHVKMSSGLPEPAAPPPGPPPVAASRPRFRSFRCWLPARFRWKARLRAISSPRPRRSAWPQPRPR